MNTKDLIDLSGEWELALGDADGTGTLSPGGCRVHLPGSLQEQGFGNQVTVDTPWTGQIVDRSWFTAPRYTPYRELGNVKVPFWLQPEKHYVGAAWYVRQVEVPAEWAGRRIVLTLERPHIQTTVWLDGVSFGSKDSLGTPHVYDFGANIKPGVHELRIRVDNRLQVNVGTNSHSVTDHTQSNWNGIVGRIELAATSPVWIDEAQVYPDVRSRNIRVRVRIGNASGAPGEGILAAGASLFKVVWSEKGGEAEFRIELGAGAALWDEFSPALHRLSLRLTGPATDHESEIVFGLREVSTEGTQILVNGRPVFLRGTLECAVFPQTGFPPTDVAEWKRILAICRDYGFNHVRFHSWCPPKAAFVAADECGMYLQIECSSWANTTTGLGLGEPIDEWLYEEAHAMIKAYGNHPSFLLMAYGNEPGGEMEAYLGKWVPFWKEEEPRRLHTSAGGWPVLEANDFDNIYNPRIQLWGDGLNSRINRLPPATTADYEDLVKQTPRPIVSHEMGEWCVYPDFSEIGHYTGVLRPRNFEIFRESLAANHMGDQAADFVQASGRLQILCYREDVESALRTKGLAGFQLLQANDFPGQGTALVGWLNALWEPKGYVTPEEFRRFNAPTVLLARLEKRTFSTADVFRAAIEVAHFGSAPLDRAVVEWSVSGDDDGKAYASGKFDPASVPLGNGWVVGEVEASLDLPAPAKYRLTARFEDGSCENDWDIWVYPSRAEIEAPENIKICRSLKEVLDNASPGRKLLFLPRPEDVAGDVELGFSSIFWNTAWTKGQAPHTLGILCQPKHPLFAGFPTEFHSNWQWWEPIVRSKALVLDTLPPKLRPTVQIIDDWFTNRRLGLVFEARFRGASLLVSGTDFLDAPADWHSLRQFGASVFQYMDSPAFLPEFEIGEEALQSLLRPE